MQMLSIAMQPVVDRLLRRGTARTDQARGLAHHIKMNLVDLRREAHGLDASRRRQAQRPRVRQLGTQVFDLLVCRFQKCHYSRVICSGRRGLESLRVANKALCSALVVDRPAEDCEPFKVMR